MARIAVFGAGMAGISFMKDFDGNGQVVLVDPKDYVEVPFAMLRSMTDPDRLGRSPRRAIDDMFDAEHHQGRLAELRSDSALLDDGSELSFDYAVLATGSTIRGFDNLKVAEARTRDEREAEWSQERERLIAARSVIVIGGGPIGVELSGEILSAFPDKQLTLIQSADQLLPAFDSGIGGKARRVLEELGATIVLGQRATVDAGSVSLDDGTTIEADLVYTATGNVIDTSYMDAHFQEALDARGRIKVDEYLRVVGSDRVFAVGDMNDVPGIKLGAFAGQQGSRAASNITASLAGREMKAFKPETRPVGLVTLGQDAGLARLPWFRFDPMHRMKQRDFFVARYLG